ncbi:MAG: type II toxin-antitoxin system RelE/ParE family toxin [Proteobacteria bacterium]|nr:type II toxin-antitoxin system RelE/ParE family toxin [Pseudomonadota bacterium]MBU1695424.1 type II toxin-antitoxin system RelE/ParE family toxin [Pseudomonadota bacterium]
MTWEITFYNEKVKMQIRLFPIGIQTNLTYILELIKELGPNLGKPHTAPLGKGLKTPKKDLDLAIKRMKEIKNE